MKERRGAKIWITLWHAISEWLIYPVCYYLVRYRRKVVRENLRIAFPNKSEKERLHIEKDFYLYFCDMIAELMAGRHLSNEEMKQHVILGNTAQLQQATLQHGGAFVMMGHFLNWEWLGNMGLQITNEEVTFATIYKKLKSPFFDDLMRSWRTKRCGEMIEMKQLLRHIVNSKGDESVNPTIYGMGGDQRPTRQGRAKQYETVFLNRRVGMITGTGQLATKYHFPVFFIQVEAPKRGVYKATFIPIYDPEKDNLTTEEITERFTRLLENNVIALPARYLWTHRRFAGSKPLEENGTIQKS